MSTIDDPEEARIFLERHEDEFSHALSVLSATGWGAFITRVIDHFRHDKQLQRIHRMLAKAFRQIEALGKRVDELEDRLSEPDAQSCLCAAMHYAGITPDLNKVDRFGAVIGSAAASEEMEWSEAEAFIHDLYRLRNEDLIALAVMDEVLGPFVTKPAGPAGPKFTDVPRSERQGGLPFNEIQNGAQNCVSLAQEKGLEKESYYAACSRLTGFGLAFELKRGTSLEGTWDRCYYPSTRGKLLNSLLSEPEEKPER